LKGGGGSGRGGEGGGGGVGRGGSGGGGEGGGGEGGVGGGERRDRVLRRRDKEVSEADFFNRSGGRDNAGEGGRRRGVSMGEDRAAVEGGGGKRG